MKEVFRGVNKYLDFTTGEELVKYGKVYNTPGPARAYTTRMSHPRGRNSQAASFNNPNGDVFRLVETWLERAKEWERV